MNNLSFSSVYLGIRYHEGIFIPKMVRLGNIFPVQGKRGSMRPTLIIRLPDSMKAKKAGTRKAFDLGKALFKAHADRIGEIQTSIGKILPQATIGLKQVGLFGLIAVDKEDLDQPDGLSVQPQNGQGLYFSYPHGQQIIILASEAFPDRFKERAPSPFIAAAVLAHACQRYWEMCCPDPGTFLQARVRFLVDRTTRQLFQMPVIKFVLGQTQEDASAVASAIMEQLRPDQQSLLQDFERQAIIGNPDYGNLIGLVNDSPEALNKQVEDLGLIYLPGADIATRMWGLVFSPLEAYQFLARYMLATAVGLPEFCKDFQLSKKDCERLGINPDDDVIDLLLFGLLPFDIPLQQ